VGHRSGRSRASKAVKNQVAWFRADPYNALNELFGLWCSEGRFTGEERLDFRFSGPVVPYLGV
jgi:hypothetical protein